MGTQIKLVLLYRTIGGNKYIRQISLEHVEGGGFKVAGISWLNAVKKESKWTLVPRQLELKMEPRFCATESEAVREFEAWVGKSITEGWLIASNGLSSVGDIGGLIPQ